MGMVESMKDVTEDIIASHKVRTKSLGQLMTDTRKTLEGLASDRKEMTSNLKAALEEGETHRQKSFKDMMANIQKGVVDVREEVKDVREKVKELLNGFKKERENMAAIWQDMVATLGNGNGKKLAISASAETEPDEEVIIKKARKRGRKRG